MIDRSECKQIPIALFSLRTKPTLAVNPRSLGSPSRPDRPTERRPTVLG